MRAVSHDVGVLYCRMVAVASQVFQVTGARRRVRLQLLVLEDVEQLVPSVAELLPVMRINLN